MLLANGPTVFYSISVSECHKNIVSATGELF